MVCIVLSLFRCTGSAVFTHLVMHVYIKLNVVCRFLFLSLRDLVVADGWCTCSSNVDGMIAYLIVLYNMVFFLYLSLYNKHIFLSYNIGNRCYWGHSVNVMKTTESIGGRCCTVYTTDGAGIVLLQPVDDHDLSLLDVEVEMIGGAVDVPFCLVAFQIRNWMLELTPWPAPPTFGRQPFGDGAGDTLRYVAQCLLPALAARWGNMKVVLGGYSLAGLFSLWAGYNSRIFDGVAAASPSVWYPRWTDYTVDRAMHSAAVYLSLGDRESHAKNPVMSHVDEAIRRQYELLVAQGTHSALEWNPGNHFVDSDKRMAKAFAWVVRELNAMTHVE